jgi:aminopeptidase-like protein
MYSLAQKLWSYPRSLTGDGVRSTLAELSLVISGLQMHEIASGTKVGDWEVPMEWNLKFAQLTAPDGTVICDTRENNLHVLGYSIPFRGNVSLPELESHLYTLPDQPSAIPYVTSYYERRWGFCMSHDVRISLQPGEYGVEIDTSLQQGSLTYADLVLPGQLEDEILVSTYVCHPSMANNELSGPVVTTELIKYLSSQVDRRYTYRFVFAPETIGAIVYLHKHLKHLKKNVKAGFVITCVGDNRTHSLLPTRDGVHEVDLVARHVLRFIDPKFKEYSWADRGSDERQYSAPLVGLPMVSMMRSKYWEYPEYHTSLDDLVNVVSPAGLAGGFEAIRQAVDILEQNVRPLTTVIGEPMLGKRGLYDTLGAGRYSTTPQTLLDVWSYCDGSRTAFEIAEVLQMRFEDVINLIELLKEHDLVKTSPAQLS